MARIAASDGAVKKPFDKKKIWLIVAIVVFVLIVLFTAFVGIAYQAITDTYASFENDLILQAERVAAMRLDPGSHVNEQSFANFDLATENPKINQIQLLNSHNSYRKYYVDYIAGLYKPFTKTLAKSMTYEHDTIVNQLNLGVRGVEIDVRSQDGKFRVFHGGLIDQGSTSPDFGLFMEELKLWSANNAGHLPVSILMEYKIEKWPWNVNDDKTTSDTLAALNQLVKDTMGDKLLTPADIIGDYADMGEAIENDNWPTLSEAKGKFMFIFHYSDKLTDKLIALDDTLKSTVLFPSIVYNSDERDMIVTHKKYASHVISNTPSARALEFLVGKNYMVRTRMDEGMEHDAQRKSIAVNSGAQMLTTDFEPGLPFPETDYVAYLKGNYTAILR